MSTEEVLAVWWTSTRPWSCFDLDYATGFPFPISRSKPHGVNVLRSEATITGPTRRG
jgi:hypothetical protein